MHRRPRWLTPLKGAIGFALGFGLWWGLTPAYNKLVSKGAEPLVRWSESPRSTVLRQKGREVLVVRTALPRGTNRPGIPLYDLTFNIALLTTLFAINRKSLGTRNALCFLLALALLYAGHVSALVAYINHIFSTDPAQGRVAEYSQASRVFWHKTIYFYRVVGGLAFAVVIWFLLQPQSERENETGPTARPKKKRR